jgi:hypothetical protein
MYRSNLPVKEQQQNISRVMWKRKFNVFILEILKLEDP